MVEFGASVPLAKIGRTAQVAIKVVAQKVAAGLDRCSPPARR